MFPTTKVTSCNLLRRGLMGWTRKLLAISVLGSMILMACSGNEVVRIGTEGAYPPFAYVNEANELEGFEIELGNELCRRVQLECRWVVNDWESIIPNLQDSKYDAIMAAMSITSERDEVIDFTQAYYPPEPSVFAARAGAADTATEGRVAVQTATIQADYLEGKVSQLLEYPLAEDTIDAVLNGEADSTFAGLSYLRDIVAESEGRLAFVGAEVPLEGGTGIGVREGDEVLREKLDHAIQIMKDDASLNELILKWFKKDALTF